ncbi:MAG: DUF4386 domain-containing protein [Anaerolineaceae bacterium]|nr:DUF4386 domain-containing protein [Anaerolineaceae bacterium]
MNIYKKAGRIVGLFFICATVAGILGMFFSGSVQTSDYLIQVSENKNQMLMASFFILIMAVSVAGIAITAYPILKKNNQSLALGYVCARIVEGILFILTVFSWLILILLSQEYVRAGSPDASYFQTIGNLLLSVSNWAGHVVLDIVIAPVHYLIFYFLLYRSKLVPRWLSVWGLIGVPCWLAAGVLAVFDFDPTSNLLIILNLPIAINEMVLAVWLIIKGFKPPETASRK